MIRKSKKSSEAVSKVLPPFMSAMNEYQPESLTKRKSAFAWETIGSLRDIL
jgi:hypothetical protein